MSTKKGLLPFADNKPSESDRGDLNSRPLAPQAKGNRSNSQEKPGISDDGRAVRPSVRPNSKKTIEADASELAKMIASLSKAERAKLVALLIAGPGVE
ncbi:hypothetical protein KIH39_09995 [Telmatocola sphagniphila]|uniref:Uncharacterized protein n=1 Tax=Telmatocola sphagniphila TaxID=1123043 RepID=A0A8E6BA60_9BACT|nr:hypothetical protein [Telmatocola sphagniphila]QVL34214.1 hypothetical protein KIH39_09995 [Telmatocola sphagniphila]